MKYKYTIYAIQCQLKAIGESIDRDFNHVSPANTTFLDYITNQLKFLYYELSKLDSSLAKKIFNTNKKNRSLILVEMQRIGLLHARIRTLQKRNNTIKDHGLMTNILVDGYKETFYNADELIIFSTMVTTIDDMYREVGMKIIDQNQQEHKYVFYKYFDGCIDSNVANIRRATELNIVVQLANLELMVRLRQQRTITTSIEYDFHQTHLISELLTEDSTN